MTIGEFVKEKQPDDFKVITKRKKRRNRKRKLKDKEKLSESVIKDLMKHSAYKRGSGGAIKQVR